MKYLIPGNPVPLMRPRGFGTRVYDPQREIKEQIAIILRYQHGSREMFTGPIELEITFFMPISVALSMKKKNALIDTYHIKRPDIDNLLKFMCDVAHHVLYDDDCIIALVKAKKVYSLEPRTEFMVRPL